MLLNQMIQGDREQVEGLRPHSEISNLVTQAIEVKETNPARIYKVIKVIGKGACGEVFLVKQKADETALFAMKCIDVACLSTKQTILNEASLIAYLDCDEIARCKDLYFHRKKIFILLEFMECGSLNHIILDKDRSYSEDFCRWSLYKVAKGLQAMHNQNVLHRDIKSDNLLGNLAGDIKIADLGASKFLSLEN